MRTLILSAALAAIASLAAATASAQSYRSDGISPAAWSWGDGQYYSSYQDCETARRNKTVAGAVIGGVVGGVLGRSIAADNARTEGTALGAAAGAVVGGAIGRSQAKCDSVAGYSDRRSSSAPVYRDSGYQDVHYRFPAGNGDDRYARDYDRDGYGRDAHGRDPYGRDSYGRGRVQQCGWGEAIVTDPHGRVIRREPVEFCRRGASGRWRPVH